MCLSLAPLVMVTSAIAQGSEAATDEASSSVSSDSTHKKKKNNLAVWIAIGSAVFASTLVTSTALRSGDKSNNKKSGDQ